MGFVFYDTETTGLKQGFDQIVQFAAIHTDADLVELDRFEMRCRLQPHVIPHPSALLANGISIGQLTDPNLPSHYDMVASIRRQLAAWGPAIFVGYNSIRFDEEMLRHAFFQSLFPAFLTTMPPNCRADAMNLVLAACAARPASLSLPTGPEGRPTFKLAAVAQANGLDATRAHNAMGDAEMTLELCRRVQAGADDVWQRFVRFSNKAVVADFVRNEEYFFLTEFFGGEATHRLVTRLGSAPNDTNGHLCWDLETNPADLADMDDLALNEVVCRPIGPVRRLRVNAAPSVCAHWDAPEWLEFDPGVAERRAAWLQAHSDFVARVVGLYAERWKDAEPSAHPELRLYSDPFPGPADEARMWDFHESGKARRLSLARDFDDARLRAFGHRLVYAEHRSALPEADRVKADRRLASRLIEEAGGPLTLPVALALVDQECDRVTGAQRDLLFEYRAWLKARLDRASAHLGEHLTGPLSYGSPASG